MDPTPVRGRSPFPTGEPVSPGPCRWAGGPEGGSPPHPPPPDVGPGPCLGSGRWGRVPLLAGRCHRPSLPPALGEHPRPRLPPEARLRLHHPHDGLLNIRTRAPGGRGRVSLGRQPGDGPAPLVYLCGPRRPGARSRGRARPSPVRHGWRETGQHDHRALHHRGQLETAAGRPGVVVMPCQGSGGGAAAGRAVGLGRARPASGCSTRGPHGLSPRGSARDGVSPRLPDRPRPGAPG